jgi:hypothetical protein
MFPTANKHQLGRITRVTMAVNVLATTTFTFIMCVGAAGADPQGAASVTPGESSKDQGDDQERQIATIKSITGDAMKHYNLKALIVQVTADGRQIYTDASGESMAC